MLNNLPVTARTLAAFVALCLPLLAACGEAGGRQVAEPATKLVANHPSAPSASASASGSASASASPACPSGYVALTFDDGPSPLTPRFLTYLTAHQVPATFFIVGSRMAYQVPIVQREQRADFAIGNHTWSHADLRRLPDAGIRREVRSTEALFQRSGIRPSDLVRPPYGAIDPRVEGVLSSMGLRPFQWTIDSEDWLSGGPQTIAQRVIAAIRPHRMNVVLMHDGLSGAVDGRVASLQTVGALSLVVSWARQHGYCFTAPDRPGWAFVMARMRWQVPGGQPHL